MTDLTEQAGKVSTALIDGLKTQPILLALVLLQSILLGALLYASLRRQEAISEQFRHLYQLLQLCLSPRG